MMVNLHLISLAKTLDVIVLGVPAVMNTVLVNGDHSGNGGRGADGGDGGDAIIGNDRRGRD
ncbi:MAG: hypothetical protein ACRD8W_31670 [Nitrososphaeraceae archaeon]